MDRREPADAGVRPGPTRSTEDVPPAMEPVQPGADPREASLPRTAPRPLRQPELPAEDGPRSPRVPLSDAVFCAGLKVYLTFSGRRAMTDIRDAAERGYIASAPHF